MILQEAESNELLDEVPATMQAAVFTGPGEPLKITTLLTPEPAPDEVLVKVAACGLCHTDLHVLQGDVGFVSPAVLGHEIAGTIVAVGEHVPADLVVGARVVGAFVLPCGRCEACRRGRDDLCPSFFDNNRLRGVMHDGRTRLVTQSGDPVGMYSMGGHAEYAVVPASSVTPLAARLPLAESAVLGCAAMTAYGAVRHGADLRPGASVAVVATGGVGVNVVQLAHAFGADPIIAVDVSAGALDIALRHGATRIVDASEHDPVERVRDLTDGRGVDVAFEVLGTPGTFQQALEMLVDGGRLVAVGIAPGRTSADVEITRMVRRSLQIVGSYGARVRTDLPRVAAMAAAGKISPHRMVTQSFGLDQVNEAFAALANRRITGRAVVCP